MGFKIVVRDIQSLKIQGAENIAITAVTSIQDLVKKNQFSSLEKAKYQLLNSRPTEPCMRNSLNYIFKNIDLKKEHPLLRKELLQRINYVLNHFANSGKKIAGIGARKIKQGSVVFTHCHSSTVINILKEAKKHVSFKVHNTETRPLYQGRITAKELIKAKIPVTMYVDSGARLALRDADLMLIGCDAINAEGKIINKIGSEMFAEIAHLRDVPVYVCTNSWKFDPKTILGYEGKIETRAFKEVWEHPPKGLRIDNHAFEKINPDLIAGVISELGICPVSLFIEEIKNTYKWMF